MCFGVCRYCFREHACSHDSCLWSRIFGLGSHVSCLESGDVVDSWVSSFVFRASCLGSCVSCLLFVSRISCLGIHVSYLVSLIFYLLSCVMSLGSLIALFVPVVSGLGSGILASSGTCLVFRTLCRVSCFALSLTSCLSSRISWFVSPDSRLVAVCPAFCHLSPVSCCLSLLHASSFVSRLSCRLSRV